MCQRSCIWGVVKLELTANDTTRTTVPRRLEAETFASLSPFPQQSARNRNNIKNGKGQQTQKFEVRKKMTKRQKRCNAIGDQLDSCFWVFFHWWPAFPMDRSSWDIFYAQRKRVVSQKVCLIHGVALHSSGHYISWKLDLVKNRILSADSP